MEKIRESRCRSSGSVIDRVFLTDGSSTVETAAVWSVKRPKKIELKQQQKKKKPNYSWNNNQIKWDMNWLESIDWQPGPNSSCA